MCYRDECIGENNVNKSSNKEPFVEQVPEKSNAGETGTNQTEPGKKKKKKTILF